MQFRQSPSSFKHITRDAWKTGGQFACHGLKGRATLLLAMHMGLDRDHVTHDKVRIPLTKFFSIMHGLSSMSAEGVYCQCLTKFKSKPPGLHKCYSKADTSKAV